MTIKNSDISVVIQGPYNASITPISISSVRKFLPEAKIILSTWKGVTLPRLDCDQIILNDDPGNCFGNVNRQLISTRAGILKSDTKYILKMRSDFELLGSNFLAYFGKFKKRAKDMRIFQERVVCYGWKHKLGYKNKRLFHPGDFYYFGLKSDILKIFNIPLFPEKDGRPLCIKEFGKLGFSAEQYIWYTLLKQNGVSLHNLFSDVDNFSNKPISDLSYANNLIFLTYPEFSIRANKDHLRKNNMGINFTAIDFHDWAILYKKYCDPSYIVEKRHFIHPFKRMYIKMIILSGGIFQALVPLKRWRIRIRQYFAGIAEKVFYS